MRTDTTTIMEEERARKAQSLCNLLDKVTALKDEFNDAAVHSSEVYLSIGEIKTRSLSHHEIVFIANALSHEINNVLRPQIEAL